LTICYDHPRVWQDDECQALARYRDVVASTLPTAAAAHNAGELVVQLQYALDYRVIIDRGVGYLMACDQADAMIAFNRLRRAARETQTKIGDVAQRLASTGWLPTEASRSASPRFCIASDPILGLLRDHIRGPADDFECLYCGQAQPVVRALLANFRDLRYVCPRHPNAAPGAEAAEAADRQGAF